MPASLATIHSLLDLVSGSGGQASLCQCVEIRKKKKKERKKERKIRYSRTEKRIDNRALKILFYKEEIVDELTGMVDSQVKIYAGICMLDSI